METTITDAQAGMNYLVSICPVLEEGDHEVFIVKGGVVVFRMEEGRHLKIDILLGDAVHVPCIDWSGETEEVPA